MSNPLSIKVMKHNRAMDRLAMKSIMAQAKRYGWSCQEIAVLLDKSPSTVSGWGRGAAGGTQAERDAIRNLKPKELTHVR